MKEMEMKLKSIADFSREFFQKIQVNELLVVREEIFQRT